MKKNYLAFLFWSIALISSAQYSWTVKDTFPGTPRLFGAGLSINGMGYLIGGGTSLSPFTVVNDVWQYDPTSDSWSQKSNFPSTTSSASSFAINNTGYVVGGSNVGGHYVSTTYAYNTSLDTWTSKAAFPENGVAGAFQFVINGLGFVGTGARNGSNNSSTMYSYNPGSNSWSPAASYPGPQSLNMSAFAIDSFAYAGLGQDGSGNFYAQFYKYNPITNAWSVIAPFPGKPRSGAMSFVLNGKAYVGGGVRDIGGTPYALGDFYEYDPSTNKWSAVPGFPGAPRHNVTSIVINNVAFTVCGYDDDGQEYYNLVSEFGTCSAVSGILPLPGGGNTKAGVEIYPNPSTNDVTVKISNVVNSEIKYEIVSVDGKMIKTGTTTQNTFGFSANNLANGVYILTITDSQGTQGAGRFEVMH